MSEVDDVILQDSLDALQLQLGRCQKLLKKGYSGSNGGIKWLNSLCGNFLNYTNNLGSFIADLQKWGQTNTDLSSVCLCLAQICVCTKYLERTIRTEQTMNVTNTMSRRHFLDRIEWCLKKLSNACRILAFPKEEDHNKQEKGSNKLFESFEFSELVFLSQDYVKPFSSFSENDSSDPVEEHVLEKFRQTKWLRSVIDVMLGQVLGFANVALKQDKPALSALCQKVLRDYIGFESECTLCEENEERAHWYRRLKAVALENSLSDLMNYVNDALMRIVYTCFLDFEKFSIDILRAKIRRHGPEDTILDEFIADFDINLDRTTQIGLFVVHFTQTNRVRTLVRSCVASLEALDTCLIPSLQGNNVADIHSEILEEHFNEEVTKFKTAIYEIVDSRSFAICYSEMLTKSIEENEKDFNKANLNDVVQMGTFLIENFQLPTKSKSLTKCSESNLYLLFKKFTLMLHECKAILVCADQVQPGRILKRLKILRAVLRKFINEFSRKAQKKMTTMTQPVIPKTFDINNSQAVFQEMGVAPSACTILYRDEAVQRAKLQGSTYNSTNVSKMLSSFQALPPCTSHTDPSSFAAPKQQSQNFGVYRKQSLRTAMFKQKTSDTQKAFDLYLQNSASLQLTEILDQLTRLSINTMND